MWCKCDAGEQNHWDFTNPQNLNRWDVVFILLRFPTLLLPFLSLLCIYLLPFPFPPQTQFLPSSTKMGTIETDRTVTGFAAKDPSGILSPYTYTLRSSSSSSIPLSLFQSSLNQSSYFSPFLPFLAETPAPKMFSSKSFAVESATLIFTKSRMNLACPITPWFLGN